MKLKLNNMLINEVVPRLRAAAPSIPKIGCEDDEEIVQDATLMAARMMDAAEKAGRSFTAGNIAYSPSERHAADAGATIRAVATRCRPVVRSTAGRGMCRWTMSSSSRAASSGTSAPCTISSHRWTTRAGNRIPPRKPRATSTGNAFLASHPPRHRTAICVLVAGGTMREAGKRCGLKDSAALNLRRRIAANLIEFFGEDVIRRLLDGTRPGWESDLRTSRERSHSQEAGAFRPLAQVIC